MSHYYQCKSVIAMPHFPSRLIFQSSLKSTTYLSRLVLLWKYARRRFLIVVCCSDSWIGCSYSSTTWNIVTSEQISSFCMKSLAPSSTHASLFFSLVDRKLVLVEKLLTFPDLFFSVLTRPKSWVLVMAVSTTPKKIGKTILLLFA